MMSLDVCYKFQSDELYTLSYPNCAHKHTRKYKYIFLLTDFIVEYPNM